MFIAPLTVIGGHGRKQHACERGSCDESARCRLRQRQRPAICSSDRAELVMAEPKKPRPSSPRASMSAIRRQAEACRRCDLWKHATQTVFGEGPRSGARIMLVGEQPGDAEYLEGKPFVGPAGQLLRHALEDAGIDLSEVSLRNAVNHCKWEPRGKRRIHKKPRHSEVQACRVWLDAEIALVKP